MSSSSTTDAALEAAVAAAERSIRALEGAADEPSRRRLEEESRKLLGQAERLRAARDAGPLRDGRSDHPPEVPPLLSTMFAEQLPTRLLSTREHIIILEGSRLNGFVFPPWKGPPDPGEFDLKNGEARFMYVKRKDDFQNL